MKKKHVYFVEIVGSSQLNILIDADPDHNDFFLHAYSVLNKEQKVPTLPTTLVSKLVHGCQFYRMAMVSKLPTDSATEIDRKTKNPNLKRIPGSCLWY